MGGIYDIAGIRVDYSIVGKLPIQQAKKVVEFVFKSKRKNRIRALDRYLKHLLDVATSYAPIEKGPLREAHFARVSSIIDGLDVVLEFGFDFTSGMRRRSVRKQRPEGFNYGAWLHDNSGWTPRIAGVGPKWLIKAWNDTATRRKKSIEEFR